jgi:hypothetical protein
MDDELARNQRFLRETEQAIRLTNNEIIHKRVPPLTIDRMLSFAIVVAKLRAQYIEAALSFADMKQAEATEKDAKIDELGLYRRQFEEVRDAFIALQRAIELGYMAVE